MVGGTVHVIGAGMAGLACAVELTRQGRRVAVHEATLRAGGRCRSFEDAVVGRTIDNGNHLILSGNRAVHAYLRDIGAADALVGPERAAYPFFDLATGERWTLRPGRSRIPWWVLSASRRIPGTRAVDYLAALRLARAVPGDTVAAVVGTGGAMFRRFWEPLTVAVLNTDADEAAASLLWPVIRETFGGGEAACRPRLARRGLGPDLVDPAVAWLERNRCVVRFGHRLRSLVPGEGQQPMSLNFGEGRIDLAADDAVVLAVPPAAAGELLPDLMVPRGSRAIVNAHFRLPQESGAPRLLGLIGGLSQWLFLRGDVASVTISAADAVVDESADDLAARIWQEVCRALRLGPLPLVAYRVIKEKRATFAQTPAEVARRPAAATRWHNLWLAGDWTDTGLPATIEGAIRSGQTAARLAAAAG